MSEICDMCYRPANFAASLNGKRYHTQLRPDGTQIAFLSESCFSIAVKGARNELPRMPEAVIRRDSHDNLGRKTTVVSSQPETRRFRRNRKSWRVMFGNIY